MIKKQHLIALLLMLFSVINYAQVMNEAQGTGSGVSITSGDYNTHYGDSSGSKLTSGLYTTFIGYMAGKSHTVQSDNTFIGARAGEFSITGTDNTFIGKDAGRYCDGTDNTVIGTEAGMSMISGASDNTIIGEEAGQALIDGDDNVFVGEDAGFNTIGSNGGSSRQGSDNTFVGSTAGRSNTTGYGNAFFGDEAGYDNTTGYWNTAIGDSAGIDGDVGIQNTYVGHGAGCATENASHNTFIGAYAGGDNNRTNSTTNAMRNTYLGTATGFSNREGSDNVGIGQGADFGNTNRSRCIFIGGTGFVTNGQWSADGFHSVNANDATSIGYQAQTDAQYGIGIGHFMDQHGVQSVSLGYSTNTEAAADFSVLIGATGYLDKGYSVGLGYATSVSGINSIALGANTTVTTDNSIAIGQGVTVNQENTMALGGDALTNNRLSVGIGTMAANLNASLDLADVDKGLLINRVTTAERTTMTTTPASGVALTTTDVGLLVYDTDLKGLFSWDGTQWMSSSNTDAQDLTLAANILSLTNDGTTVDLSGYLDNTDAQDLTLVTNTLSLTNDGTTVDLSGYLDNTDAQDLSLSGTTLSLTNDGTTVDLSVLQDGTGTDSQELSLATNTLSISGGTNTVDLSAYVNTDTQNLTAATLTGSIIQIDIQNGSSVSVDIAPLIADLENRVTALEACDCTVLPVSEFTMGKMNPLLQQNIPNPFNGTSTIGYYIPQSVSQAEIIFSNNVGQIVNRVAVKKKGEGEISVNASNYASGMYYYTLYLDGKKIDTKKMIVN